MGYCGKEHQNTDWVIHKRECKVFQRCHMGCNIVSSFHRDEDMLAKYPLAGKGRQISPRDKSVCGLCHRTSDDISMTRTRCCKNYVCDSEGQYVMFSYSRDLCPRSHGRYTLCGHHAVECDEDLDWRVCPSCLSESFSGHVGDRLWRGLNQFNFCPLLEESVPKHSLCDTCSACNKLFISGEEGCSIGGGSGGIRCGQCGAAGI